MTVAFRASVGMGDGMVWKTTVQADDKDSAIIAARAAYARAFGHDPELDARIDAEIKYQKDAARRCVHCWVEFPSRVEMRQHQWTCLR